MVKGKDKEIPKDIYDRAMANNGRITEDDESEIFSRAILCGYGLYNTSVYEKDGKYFCSWYMGDGCD